MPRFQPGQSGNPAGKPKGSKDRRTELRALLQPHAKDLVQRCVDLALGGDTTALRICMDRLVAPVREEAMGVEVPPIGSAQDCVAAQAAVIAAVAAGTMLPSQAQIMSMLIEAQRRAYETGEISSRLAVLEERLKRP